MLSTAGFDSTSSPSPLMRTIPIGDRSKIEAGVKELGLGEMKFLDADGKPL